MKEIPYDIKPVSLIKAGGEQHSNDFREINPMEQVPALQIDGHTFVESLSIMQYLEETRPHRPLMPQDVVKRAKVRCFTMFFTSHSTKTLNMHINATLKFYVC